MIALLMVWVSFYFTAPDGSPPHGNQQCASYYAQGLDDLGVRYPIKLYAWRSALAPPPAPNPAGTPDTVHAWFANDSRPRMFRLFSKDPSANESEPSNAVVHRISPNLRSDSAYADLSSGHGWRWTMPVALDGGIWMAGFSRAPGDSSWHDVTWGAPGTGIVPRIAGVEELQRADRINLCREFSDSLGPYWALRGVRRRDCP